MHTILNASERQQSDEEKTNLSSKASWPSAEKKERKILLCIYVMFACETLTVDSGEKHFGAVKMKRVWLPPSVEEAACHIRCHGNWEEKLWDWCKHQSLNLSIGLVWKKRWFLIRNDASDWHLIFLKFIANFFKTITLIPEVYKKTVKDYLPLNIFKAEKLMGQQK